MLSLSITNSTIMESMYNLWNMLSLSITNSTIYGICYP